MLSLGLSLLLSLPGGPIQAQPEPVGPATSPDLSVEQPDVAPLDLAALQTAVSPVNLPGYCPVPPELVTAHTVCQASLTIPSLWWAREQFGGRLLENWLAYTADMGSPRRIDLVVNPQVWSLLNYTERYAFVNQFGATAKDYRYNTRIFNRQGGFLAAYTCDFSQLPPVAEVGVQSLLIGSATPVPCRVLLNSSRRDGLRGRPPGL